MILKHNPILVATHKFKVQQDNQRKGKGKGGLLYASVLAPNKCCDKGNVTNGWQEKQTNIAINVRLETFLYSAHNNNLKVNPKLLTHKRQSTGRDPLLSGHVEKNLVPYL